MKRSSALFLAAVAALMLVAGCDRKPATPAPADTAMPPASAASR